MRTIALLLLMATVALAGELSKPAKRLLDSAGRMAKASRFRDRQGEMLAKKLEGVTDDDLSAVIENLKAVEKPGKSHAAVVAFLQKQWFTRKYGPEPLEKIPGLAALVESKDPEKQEEAVAKALGLEDLRLARALAIRAAKAGNVRVRLRAAVALGDLITYGTADKEVQGALVGLVADDDPGVRAVAIRRGFEARFDPIFDWAIERLDDSAKAKVNLRGEDVELSPGREALSGLTELTWVQRELTYGRFRKLKAGDRDTLIGLFRAWWKERGGMFPVPGFREAAFRRKPSTVKTVVLGKDETAASFQLWSGLDRTRIRVAVDEIRLIATSRHDWRLNFHVRYMASGMRPDDGEGFRRNHFVGTPYVLARKVIGCYVFVFQNLVDGRLKIRLQYHDLVRK